MIRSKAKAKGDITELRVAARLLELGIQVSFPHGDSGGYDLVAEYNGVFKAIQCKTLHREGAKLKAALNSHYRKPNKVVHLTYDPKKIPLFCFHNPSTGKVYWLPNTGQTSANFSDSADFKWYEADWEIDENFLENFKSYEKVPDKIEVPDHRISSDI